jgi:hypothetical protein
MLMFMYLLWAVPEYGLQDPRSMLTWPLIVILSFIGYYIARWYRKSKGIDPQLAFKEIPPV